MSSTYCVNRTAGALAEASVLACTDSARSFGVQGSGFVTVCPLPQRVEHLLRQPGRRRAGRGQRPGLHRPGRVLHRHQRDRILPRPRRQLPEHADQLAAVRCARAGAPPSETWRLIPVRVGVSGLQLLCAHW